MRHAKDWAAALAAEFACSKQEAARRLRGFLRVIRDALARGEKVLLKGVGTLEVGAYAGKEARNPKTGAKVSVPPQRKLKVSTSKPLYEALNAKE